MAEGKRKTTGSSRALGGRGPECPTVCLDDRTANREAHPHSSFFRHVEGVEGFVKIAQSRSVIANLDE